MCRRKMSGKLKKSRFVFEDFKDDSHPNDRIRQTSNTPTRKLFHHLVKQQSFYGKLSPGRSKLAFYESNVNVQN